MCRRLPKETASQFLLSSPTPIGDPVVMHSCSAGIHPSCHPELDSGSRSTTTFINKPPCHPLNHSFTLYHFVIPDSIRNPESKHLLTHTTSLPTRTTHSHKALYYPGLDLYPPSRTGFSSKVSL